MIKRSTPITLITVTTIALILFITLYMNGFTNIRHNTPAENGQIKVACVGDSVTYGHGIKNWPKNNYPALLQKMLGESYNVGQFGESGLTVHPNGDQPYPGSEVHSLSVAYEADILVFMLGSNDSKPENWKGAEEFKEKYNSLLDSYLQGEKQPKVYICTPATAYFPKGVTEGLTNYDIQPAIIEEIVEIVRQVAKERSYEIIDINTLTENRRDLFGIDNVHPNNEGAKAIAEAVYKAIKVQ